MMKLTPGKFAGLKAVSDDRRVIAVVAIDQRGSLLQSLTRAKAADAGRNDLEEFKVLVTKVLTRHASAILLDPEYGLPAANERNGKGLLLAYEKTGYDAKTTSRIPDLLDLWSVRRLQEVGADCVKILLYYSPFENPALNNLKQAWIERIGDECIAHDIPFFLQCVGYSVTGSAGTPLAYALDKPKTVRGIMAEFSKARYSVDMLNVEVPVEMSFVEGTRAYKGEKGIHSCGSLAVFSGRCQYNREAIHLSLRWCFQSNFRRNTRARRRLGCSLQRRLIRKSVLAGWDSGLRKARFRCFRRLAQYDRRRKHHGCNSSFRKCSFMGQGSQTVNLNLGDL